MTASDYQVKIRVRNGRIVRKMRERGFDSMAALVQTMNGASDYPHVCNLIGMKITPLTQNGDWRPVVLRLCDALNCMPDDLFNEQQLSRPLRVNASEAFMGADQIAMVMRDGIEATEAKIVVRQLIESLKPREKEVIEARLDGATLAEVARQMGITRDWAGKIEERAHRRMRKAARPKVRLVA